MLVVIEQKGCVVRFGSRNEPRIRLSSPTHGPFEYTLQPNASSFVNTQTTNKPLTCGNTVPEVGLELHSRP